MDKTKITACLKQDFENTNIENQDIQSLLNKPKEIWAKKCCFNNLCNKENKPQDDFSYVFVPYKDEFDNFFQAYVEVDKSYLDHIIKNTNDNVIELVSNFQILHIEPGSHITNNRKSEIENFFHACRQHANYHMLAAA